jgi:ribosomal protein L25 (general stress protein Ctc)
MGVFPPGRITWPLPIKYLGGQVTLRAMKRVKFGTHQNVTLRKEGFVPARLQGDWLPDKWLQLFNSELRVAAKAPGFQRRLLKLILDDGEEVLALPKQADRSITTKLVEVEHVGFVRWPRDPESNPLKLNIPVTIVNEDKMPIVRRLLPPPPPPPPPHHPRPPPASPGPECCCCCPPREGELKPCAPALAQPLPRPRSDSSPHPSAGEAGRVRAQYVRLHRRAAGDRRDARLPAHDRGGHGPRRQQGPHPHPHPHPHPDQGDFRWEHFEQQLPPGVTLTRGRRGFTDKPNFLVARAKKVRGS